VGCSFAREKGGKIEPEETAFVCLFESALFKGN